MTSSQQNFVIKAGFLLAMGLLLTVGWLSFHKIAATAAADRLETHTHLVIQSLDRLLADLQEVESIQRAFIITGREQDAAPFDPAASLIELRLTALRNLTADNPSQQQRLADISSLAKQRLTILKQNLAVRQVQGFEAAQQRIAADTGQRLMSSLRQAVSAAQAEEASLLTGRIRRKEESAKGAFLALVGGGALGLGLLGVIFWRLTSEVTRRGRAELELRRHQDHLQERVAARTEELHQANQLLRQEMAERQHSEEEVRRLNQQLEARVRARTAELEASNKELEAFCYSVSHDLRAPLRAIDGFSQILIEDHAPQLDAEGQTSLRNVRLACQSMGELIDDLLDLSRLSRAAMDRQAVNLTRLAREIAAGLQQAAPQRRAVFRIAEGLAATGDPHLLRAALQNLLENAWKYTGPRAEACIEVGVLADGRVVPHPPTPPRLDSQTLPLPSSPSPYSPVYFVRDNGVGFDMAYVHKLFMPFHRLHSVKEFPGSGVGLAVVQRVIQRHGGRVWAEAAVGQGASFYFTLGP